MLFYRTDKNVMSLAFKAPVADEDRAVFAKELRAMADSIESGSDLTSWLSQHRRPAMEDMLRALSYSADALNGHQFWAMKKVFPVQEKILTLDDLEETEQFLHGLPGASGDAKVGAFLSFWNAMLLWGMCAFSSNDLGLRLPGVTFRLLGRALSMNIEKPPMQEALRPLNGGKDK